MGGMNEELMEPMSATSHVAIVSERQEHGWWAMLTAWIKGVRR